MLNIDKLRVSADCKLNMFNSINYDIPVEFG